MKEQYRLFFLHIGLQRYSKNGRKPPLQQLSVLFLTKIAQISHLNSFNSLYSQRSISSLEGSFKRYFDINRFSSMPEIAYSTIPLPTSAVYRSFADFEFLELAENKRFKSYLVISSDDR
jgi:hypothetical protein